MRHPRLLLLSLSLAGCAVFPALDELGECNDGSCEGSQGGAGSSAGSSPAAGGNGAGVGGATGGTAGGVSPGGAGQGGVSNGGAAGVSNGGAGAGASGISGQGGAGTASGTSGSAGNGPAGGGQAGVGQAGSEQAGGGQAGGGQAGAGSGGEPAGGTGGGGQAGTGPLGQACAKLPLDKGSPGVAVIYNDKVEFCIDQYETTWAEYDAFVDSLATKSPKPPVVCEGIIDSYKINPDARPKVADEASYPVGGVTWCQAATYCQTIGKRLCGKVGTKGQAIVLDAEEKALTEPTESEWMFACATMAKQNFPYGNEYNKGKQSNLCNGQNTGASGVLTQPVDSNPDCVSVSGALNLIGNVQEWENGCQTPAGDTPEQRRTTLCPVRGGPWNYGGDYQTCAYTKEMFERSPGPTEFEKLPFQNGIRCCWDPT